MDNSTLFVDSLEAVIRLKVSHIVILVLIGLFITFSGTSHSRSPSMWADKASVCTSICLPSPTLYDDLML